MHDSASRAPWVSQVGTSLARYIDGEDMAVLGDEENKAGKEQENVLRLVVANSLW